MSSGINGVSFGVEGVSRLRNPLAIAVKQHGANLTKPA